jgi:histidinol dehydrogenase
VLPTGGAARTWSGLSTDTFVRWTTVQETPARVAAILASDTARLARAEGLDAHASAARAMERVS